MFRELVRKEGMIMIANAIVALVGITVGSFVAHHETKAELESKAREQAAHQCDIYSTQVVSSSDAETRLEVCPSGLSYSDTVEGKEHFIPWRKVDNWQYSGLNSVRANGETQDYLDLQIKEATGFPFRENHHEFKIYCTTPEAQRVLKTLERHTYEGEKTFKSASSTNVS
jgi:hypothetical protein